MWLQTCRLTLFLSLSNDSKWAQYQHNRDWQEWDCCFICWFVWTSVGICREQFDWRVHWRSSFCMCHLMGWIMSMSGVHGTWDTFYLRELLCRREEVLSVPRILSFWKRGVSLRFLGVFLCWVFFGLCLCLGGFCFGFGMTWLFAFHLFSYNVRIVYRPQDVLMTVRASSVHGMSKKKSWYLPWHQKQALFLTWKRASDPRPPTVPMISDLFRQSL